MGLYHYKAIWFLFVAICIDNTMYASDCQNLLNGLQNNIIIWENYTAGTVLMSVEASSDTALNVTTPNLSGKINPLKGFLIFVTVSNTTKQLALTKTVDVESVFSQQTMKPDDIQITVGCESSTDSDSKKINVTVEDVDDNGPVFNFSTSGSCILPVLTASVPDDFIGKIETAPSCLCAKDGDIFINNNITYSFIHGDPIEYENYFVISSSDGAINKTANISTDEAKQFIFVIQAEEDSILRRNKVAVVRVSVHKITTFVTKEVHEASSAALLVLRILSAVVLVGFTVGFAILIRHRNTIIKPGEEKPDKSVKNKYEKDVKVVEEVLECSDVKAEWKLETIEEEPELTSL